MKLPRQVYALIHEPSGKKYIGSSSKVAKRFRVHLSQLKHGAHHNRELQADYDLQGGPISLIILDEVRSFDDRDKEYQWMKRLKTFDPRFGYNCRDPKWPETRETPNARRPHHEDQQEAEPRPRLCGPRHHPAASL